MISSSPPASPGDADRAVAPGDVRGAAEAAAERRSTPRRMLGIALVILVVGWHGRECLLRFPPGRATRGGLPFTADDHPFHYYYAQRTWDFFQHGATWGYDPTFMAGYAKTLIFPSSSSLPELVALVTGPNCAFGYRLMVAAVLFVTPLLLGLATWSLVGRGSAVGLTLVLACGWVWTGWPAVYGSWGMGPFIVAGAASVCAGCMLAGWLDSGRHRVLVAGSLLATAATITHPSSPIILVLMLTPAYVARIRSLSWRRHLVCWLIPSLVLLAWSPWWVPVVVLRDTFGTTATGFHHEEISVRLIELATARFAEESAIILTAAGAVAGLRRLRTAQFWAVLGGQVSLFLLAYVASGVRAAWFLQPGRYSQPLFDLLLVSSVVGYHARWRELWSRTGWTGLRWLGNGLSLLCLAGGTILFSVDFVQTVLFGNSRPVLESSLPPQILDLVEALRTGTDSSARILFEDRGQASLGRHDPFPGHNPSALMPLLVPRQFIGGPYLYTHLKSNFAQFGDGYFFGRDFREVGPVSFELFQRYAEQYNIGWIVLWSAPMLRLAEENPQWFRPLGRFGNLRLYALARSRNWAVAGSARVVASPSRLEVFEATPDQRRTLILSYHWIRTLKSSVPLRAVNLPDDPVPFIAVDNPPPHFVIENLLR